MTQQIDREKLEIVKQRIQKLLALGTSPNEHEAALAVAKAQELLEAYDLSMESIENLKADNRTSVRRGTEGVVKTTQGKPDGWKSDLFEEVAYCHDCVTFYNHEYELTPGGKYRTVKTGKVIGFGHDVEMVGYELAFLVSEIERLAQGYADRMWQEIRDIEYRDRITHQEAEAAYVRRTGRHPLKAKLYFIKGAAEAVISKLRSDKHDRETAAKNDNPFALVIQKQQAVRDFIYMERYGVDEATMQARWKEQQEAQKSTTPTVQKEETAAERKRREAANRRWWDQQHRKRMREEAAKDHAAYSSGKEAGRQISTRPGLNEGPNHGRIEQ